MEEIYSDLPNAGAFGGIRPLYKAAKQREPSVTLQQVKNAAQSINSYTLHKPRRYKFPRNRFIIKDIDDLWQGDIADFAALSSSNDAFKYVLVVIDSLSKYVWVEPIKRKDSSTVLAAIKEILKRAKPRKPVNWLVDKGGEFQNKSMQEFMRNAGINFYYTQSPNTKAAIAERVIRTLKGKIFRFLTHNNTWRYLDALSDVVASYNASYHRSIGMAPENVTNADVPGIKQRLYPQK